MAEILVDRRVAMAYSRGSNGLDGGARLPGTLYRPPGLHREGGRKVKEIGVVSGQGGTGRQAWAPPWPGLCWPTVTWMTQICTSL